MIRKYEKPDTDAIVDVWRKASELAHPFLTQVFLDQEADNVRNVYLAFAETWVTIEKEEVVGFIAMIENEIGGLFLDPAFHGQGLGRAMVDLAVAEKGDLKVEVFKENQVGRQFYASYGFTGEEEFLHEASGHLVLRQMFSSGSVV